MANNETILIPLERVIAFQPSLARVLGGIDETIFLQQIYFWSDKGTRDDGYIWKTNKEIEEETTLTYEKQLRIRKKLVSLGFLLEKRIRDPKGNPTMHFKLNIKAIQKQISEYKKNPTTNLTKTHIHLTEITTETTHTGGKNFDSNLVSASARFLGTEKLQGTQSKKEVLEPLIEKLNLKRGDEYEPDNLSPLDRKLIKRQTEKILGLRRATKWQKDIYGIGSDYLAAYNNTTKADYIGTVILDDVAKNIATYLERGETRQTLRDMMIAFFNSDKAKDITITPRTVFSTHTYNSWKQSKL